MSGPSDDQGNEGDVEGVEADDEAEAIEAGAERRLQLVLSEQLDAPPAELVAPEPEPLNLAPGLYLDVSHEDYHRDPSAGISLSSSVACEMLRSHRHGWRMHPKLGGKGQQKATKAMDAGALLHMMLLGKGPKLRLIDAKNFTTKKAKGEKAEAVSAGQLPVLIGAYEKMTARVVEVHTELKRRGIDLTKGAPEATIIWEEDGMLCRARADVWDAEIATIFDVKFLSSADPEGDVPRHMMNFGVDIQGSHYTVGFETLHADLVGRVQFKLVIIEQDTGEILIANRAGTMRQLGDWKRAQAFARWKESMESGKWPGYNRDEEASIEAPEWSLRNILNGGSPNLPF